MNSGRSDSIATNVTSVSNLCYPAAQQMIRQMGGKIINISSRDVSDRLSTYRYYIREALSLVFFQF